MTHRIAPWILPVALSLAACGARSLGGEDDPDGSVNQNLNQNTNDNRPDAAVEVSCAPMEAQLPANVRCGDPTPIGWAWNGESCYGIPCACEGADCDELYASEGLCYADRGPGCLPSDECMTLQYDQCEERSDCMVQYYGGGCIDLDTCEEGGPTDGNWLCWERGIVCVPSNHPCNQRGRGECDGDCYWWERRQEMCFGDMGEGDCCTSESYGYCAPVPGTTPADCEPQDVGVCHDPCGGIVAYHWDGAFCSPVLCCCEGPDCGSAYDTLAACQAAHGHCTDNPCANAGGYCLYGDYAPPTCGEGYGYDWPATADHPDACGLGTCCTPCPDPADPEVSYVSQDPAYCATIDFDCMAPDVRHFDNECGCGCITE